MPVKNKVMGGGLAGAAVTLILFALGTLGVEVEPEIAASLVTVLSFITGWFVRDT